MTESEIVKFRDLAANVDFESQDNYKSKINIIRENYFNQTTEELTSDVNIDAETPINEEVEETVVTGQMGNYVASLSRSLQKL